MDLKHCGQKELNLNVLRKRKEQKAEVTVCIAKIYIKKNDDNNNINNKVITLMKMMVTTTTTTEENEIK